MTWTPASSAVGYDIKWSRNQVHGARAWLGRHAQHATSALLPLPGRPALWVVPVRSVKPFLTGNTKMTWSKPVKIVITKPIFNVTR